MDLICGEHQRQELAFSNKERALEAMSLLVEENYVVMLSIEENSYIINYVWSPNSDRNDVIFMDRWEHEDNFYECVPEEEKDNE